MKYLVSVRPFRLFSWSDYKALAHILEQDDVKHWMEDIKPLDIIGYFRWIHLQPESLLYAILVDNNVSGFIYFYTDREVVERLHRLDVKPSLPSLEISLAKDNTVKIKGVMQQAIPMAIRYLYKYYNDHSKNSPEVIAFIDLLNVKANQLVKKSNFSQIGKLAYHPDSPIDDNVYCYNSHT